MDTEYFAISLGRGSVEQTQYSSSEDRRRDFEVERLPEPPFEDVGTRGKYLAMLSTGRPTFLPVLALGFVSYARVD
jgi:hypothetical protein